jgi:hypothetical protein
MGSSQNHDKGPTHGDSAEGYSGAYDAQRSVDQRSKSNTMPDRHMSVEADDTSLKNPEGEFDNPAPMVHPRSGQTGPGPNGPGNSKGDGSIDPQGQQGGTHGGQRSDPNEPSIPLAGPQERVEQSNQRRAGGH